MMNDPSYESVKRHYGYFTWPQRSSSFHVRHFLPNLAHHPTLQLDQREPLGQGGTTCEHYYDVLQPSLRLLVKLNEFGSEVEAHQGLLSVLAQSSAPKLPSGIERGEALGDIAYFGLDDPPTWIVFVRYNVLVQLNSIGDIPSSVLELARSLDSQLINSTTDPIPKSFALPDHLRDILTCSMKAMTTYTDIYIRDNFSDSGVIPSSGNPCQSPDIIPCQTTILTWAQISNSYAAGPDLGMALVQGGINNIYVRSKNLGTAASSGTVNLYYANSSLFLSPSTWTGNKVTSSTGLAALTLVDQTGNASIGAGALCVSNPTFQLGGLPNPNVHYCFIAVLQTPNNPITIPSSFSSNAAFAQWVQNTPAVGWRNISLVANNQVQFIRTFAFGSDDTANGYFHFLVSAKGFPPNTAISVQSTDVNCPINQTLQLPAPDPQGNQRVGFDTMVPALYSGAVNVVATSSGGAFPVGASLSFSYYAYPPTELNALHLEVGRLVQTARILGQDLLPHTAFLIPLGTCTVAVS